MHYHSRVPDRLSWFVRLTRPVRGFGRTVVFLLKVFPMLPSGPVDWFTTAPLIERVRYPTTRGEAEGDVYRPSSPGPHPSVVVCLGVVPFEVDHPQVPVLGRALERRSGVHYTEMQVSRLNPSKGQLPLWRLLRELAKFFAAMYPPLFRQSVA